MYADVVFRDEPLWSQQPGRRLALNFIPATLIVVALLMMLRIPGIEQNIPVVELVVRVLVNEVEEVVQESVFVAESIEDVEQSGSEVESVIPAEPFATETPRPTDWYAQIPAAAAAANDARPRDYFINPGFEEKRRRAAEQFAPSRAPVERPIWENVEKDTMGRTLLRSGNCVRVLDDPNVGNRDAFLVFGQYMTSCVVTFRQPRELPWVSELRNRRAGQARYGHPAAE